MEGENIVKGQTDRDEEPAGDVSLNEQDYGPAQDSQKKKEMEKSENHVRCYGARRRMDRMVIVSLGTFSMPCLITLGTWAMASTTSKPVTTLPKTQ